MLSCIEEMETRSKSAKRKGNCSKADPSCIKKERDARSHAEDKAESRRRIAKGNGNRSKVDLPFIMKERDARSHAKDKAESPCRIAKGNGNRSKVVLPFIMKERDASSHAENTAEPPRKIAIVKPMGFQCEMDPQFKLKFKVLVSSYTRFKTQVVIEGDPRIKHSLDEIYQYMLMHLTYADYMRIIHNSCTLFLKAVQEASKDPQTLPDDSVDIRNLADHDFDVWLTFEIDQGLQPKTRVETSPLCSQNKKRVLMEGTVEYDMEDIWEPIKDLLSYVLSVASRH